MKRFRTLVVLSASAMLIGTVAVAFAAGTAESDIARATFVANPSSQPVVVPCSPEDTLDSGWGMAKITGTWAGPITDTSPSPQPWNSTGPTPDNSVGGKAKISGFVIGDALGTTIISGWGKLSLTVTQNALNKYVGTAQVVVQANGETNKVEGRGQLIAKYFSRADKASPYIFTGDYLVANLEFTIDGTTFVVDGQFGGLAGTHAGYDYSVETTESC